jgi:apolipoprotein N-acyltransferase
MGDISSGYKLPRLRRMSGWYFLPALSGILLWASFPSVNQGYLAWMALVPLLVFLRKTALTRDAFLGGTIAGFLEFAGLLYWIPGVITRYGGAPPFIAWPLYLLLCVSFALFPGIVCAATHYCMSRRGPAFLLIAIPAWLSIEYLRGLIPFGGFPWLLLGYSQTEYLPLIQISDLAGVYGVSFLIVAANAAITWIWVCGKRGWIRFAPVLIVGALIAATLGYGVASLRRWDRIEPEYRVAMLQGNLSVEMPGSVLRSKYEQGYIDMAAALGERKIDLLLLPEAPTPVFFQYDQEYRDRMSRLARRYPLGLVFSNIFFREEKGVTQYFNSAFFLDHEGREIGRYDKIHLVPFGEYIPWQKIFFFSETISKDVGNFQSGDRWTTVVDLSHVMSALICFEAVFPDLSRVFVQHGSQLILNLTNDGWYGDTSAPYQHLAMARWRAVESRRFLLRASNSGISAVITPGGRLTAETGLFREESAVGAFSFLSGETFYVRHGGWLTASCAIILLLALTVCLAKRTRDL